MNYSKIIGTGSYFPPHVLTNKDLEKVVETTDEWIVTRSGIRERHIAKDERTSSLAYKAALEAMHAAKIKPADIDGIICASITQDTIMPPLSCIIQNMFGLGGKIFAFDVLAACSGFIYASSVADAYIKAGIGGKILIVGAEKLSIVTNWDDRSTCVLFGDGAGAAIVEASDQPGFRGFDIVADGSISHLLTLEGLGSNFFEKWQNYDVKNNLIKMKGNELFKVATRAMADASSNALKKSGLTIDDIDLFIPHQANLRIIEMVAKLLKFPMEKVVVTIDKYGNTSAASIPSSIDIAIREGILKKGMTVLASAFGGGITWGAMCFTY
jgi:3-oxoacyl-[acyl-carrier-protein] synthase-3